MIEIYTDGGCNPNPGPGGWAAVIIDDALGPNASPVEISGGSNSTTNNKMELTAIIRSLEHIEPFSNVVVRSDSKYVVDAFNKNWFAGWIKKKWLRGGKPIPNKDLWVRLIQANNRHSNVTFQWIKAHVGNKWNERADALATREVKARRASKRSGKIVGVPEPKTITAYECRNVVLSFLNAVSNKASNNMEHRKVTRFDELEDWNQAHFDAVRHVAGEMFGIGDRDWISTDTEHGEGNDYEKENTQEQGPAEK